MAGKKGRSGPPGNMNGVRNPWKPFWRRRVLRPEDRWLAPVLDDYLDELIADKGGADSITSGERRMAEIAQTARGAQMLILKEGKARGIIRIVDGTWDLSPGFKDLARFQGIELNALKAGKFDVRRAKDVTPLPEYVRETYGEKDENEDEQVGEADGESAQGEA